VWSFLMATAHGAGLMLIPVLMPMVEAPAHHHMTVADSTSIALAAVGVHTLALLVVTGAIAVVVYEWAGLAFLRRGWINLDLVWMLALLGMGAWLISSGLRTAGTG
jgi:hypothetical protein